MMFQTSRHYSKVSIFSWQNLIDFIITFNVQFVCIVSRIHCKTAETLEYVAYGPERYCSHLYGASQVTPIIVNASVSESLINSGPITYKNNDYVLHSEHLWSISIIQHCLNIYSHFGYLHCLPYLVLSIDLSHHSESLPRISSSYHQHLYLVL